MTGGMNYQWMSARILPAFSYGTTSYREFKVNTMRYDYDMSSVAIDYLLSSTNGFFIGVATESALGSMNSWYVGQSGLSWAYEGTGAFTFTPCILTAHLRRTLLLQFKHC